jgi:hypothetical protein
MTQRRTRSKSVSSVRSSVSRVSKASDAPSAVMALGAFVDGIYRGDFDKVSEARELAWEAMNKDALPQVYKLQRSNEDRGANLDGLVKTNGNGNTGGTTGYSQDQSQRIKTRERLL